MNRRERKIKKEELQKGRKLLRNGAPDFLSYEVDKNGQVIKNTVIAIEVKSPTGQLTYEQAVWRLILEMYDIPYRVEVVD